VKEVLHLREVKFLNWDVVGNVADVIHLVDRNPVKGKKGKREKGKLVRWMEKEKRREAGHGGMAWRRCWAWMNLLCWHWLMKS